MRIKLPNRSNLIRIKKDRSSLASLFIAVSLIALTLYPLTFPQKAHATVTEGWVRFDRLATGEQISGTACLETTGDSGTETNVVIDFPTGWTLDGTAGNWSTSTTNLPTDSGGGAATAWPSIGATASSVDGVSVTFAGGDLSADTFYCFNFDGGGSSTIGSAGDNQTGQLKTQGGSPYLDNVAWATSIVSTMQIKSQLLLQFLQL